MQRKDEPPALARLVVAGLLGAQIAILAMAASPSLHHWLHHDAGDSDHHCVVTAIANGQLDLAVAGILSVVLIAAKSDARRTFEPVAQPCSGFYVLEHAPPR
jgi:hypothetical protein